MIVAVWYNMIQYYYIVTDVVLETSCKNKEGFLLLMVFPSLGVATAAVCMVIRNSFKLKINH